MTVKQNDIYYPPGGILLWIIIFLELFTFGMAIIGLVYGAKVSPDLFHDSSNELNRTYGTINTLFLLTSGFFMATTVHLFRENKLKKASYYLNLTMIGGVLFILLKTIEYYEKIQHGFIMGYNEFFNFYWLLTGFHVIHVAVGLILLLIMKYSIKKGSALLEDVEANATFWHMCDLIWLLLFPALYLIF
jgi:nitric oxide reductase NorE protein